jgi:hypothetical protein
LRLALPALGVLGEDVEDQCRAVDDLDLHDLFELAQLTRRQLAVADDRVGALRDHDVAQVPGLARADVGCRVGTVAALDQPLEHLGAGGLGQRSELGEGVLRIRGRSLGPDTDEHDPLEAQLAVFDLGDVLQLGRQAGDAPQTLPGLEVETVTVEVGPVVEESVQGALSRLFVAR